MIWPAGCRAARIVLAPGEWAMAAPPATARRQAGTLQQELAAAVRSIGPGRPLDSTRWDTTHWVFARLPASAFSSLTGPAILHHRGGMTAVYCADTNVTGHAAAALSALAARATKLLRPDGGFQVSVTRIGHRQLPATLHPAVVRARGPEMTAYVCARQITSTLAEAIGFLSAAQAGYLAQPSAGCLRAV
jgi:hypothetical protein